MGRPQPRTRSVFIEETFKNKIRMFPHGHVHDTAGIIKARTMIIPMFRGALDNLQWMRDVYSLFLYGRAFIGIAVQIGFLLFAFYQALVL